MGYIIGDSRDQGSLFPQRMDDLISADHPVRVIDAFVGRLDLAVLGFQRALPAETGRPGYDPRDLLRLFIWGYTNRMRSSRQLERECGRNVELLWLLNRLAPDFKTIADFRRVHEKALRGTCRAWVTFCRDAGLIGADWVAIDGSKFGAVASGRAAFTTAQVAKSRAWIAARVEEYLGMLAQSDAQDEGAADQPEAQAIRTALARLADRAAVLGEVEQEIAESGRKQHVRGEPEAQLMKTANGTRVAYNVQTAVDAKHSLIVTDEVTNDCNDRQQLQPMAQAAKATLDVAELNVVADTGYSNGEQAQACEDDGIAVHAPAQRARNGTGDGTLFEVSAFTYDPARDVYQCPAGAELTRTGGPRKDGLMTYRTRACAGCAIKARCTTAQHRSVTRHVHEAAFARMAQRLRERPDAMAIRRNTVEHPFGTIKARIIDGGRFLLRNLSGARTEMSLAVLAYNLRRVLTILGPKRTLELLASPN